MEIREVKCRCGTTNRIPRNYPVSHIPRCGKRKTQLSEPLSVRAPKHAAAIRLRLYAKDTFDKTVPLSLPARKETRAVIEKAKIPVPAQECTFEIALLNQTGMKLVR